MRHICRQLLILTTLLGLLAPLPVWAQGQLDLKNVMGQPGVKLVAVEFWADWCKPCVEAIPKWRELHEKYRDRGFRLIMVGVNTSGKCSSPGWAPDRIVCDYTGEIAQAWSASDLPEGFLWTWQGNLLLEHSTVGEISARVEQWFDDTPRVLVKDPVRESGGKVRDGAALKRLVRSELRREAKFDIVLGQDELKEAKRLRKEGYGDQYDESQRCRLGMQVSPNSTLSVTVLGSGKSQRLLLELFSLEKSCLLASAVAPLGKGESGVEKAVIESIAKLITALVGKVRQPGIREESSVTERETVNGGAAPGGDAEVVRGSGKDVDLGAEEYILTVSTKPSGAMVSVNGSAPRANNSRFLLPAGVHEVSVVKEMYSNYRQQVKLTGNRRLEVELEPNWGTISVKSSPSDAAVRVNGAEVGVTPFEGRFAPGGYRVEVTKSKYLTYEKQFNLKKGEKQRISHKLDANFGTLDVSTNPPGVSVLVNGMELGKTPLPGLQVPSGKLNIELSKDGYHTVRLKGFSIKRGKDNSISETLEPIVGGIKIVVLDGVRAPLPASVYVDGHPVGQAPFASKIIIGEHVVRVKHNGQSAEERVTIREGKVSRMELVLDAVATDESAVTKDPLASSFVSTAGDAGDPTTAPWWLMAGGAGGLAAGAIMLVVSDGRKDDVLSSDELSQTDADEKWGSANSLASTGWLIGSAGLGAAAWGLVWKLTSDNVENPFFSVAPSVLPGGAAVTMGGSF